MSHAVKESHSFTYHVSLSVHKEEEDFA